MTFAHRIGFVFVLCLALTANAIDLSTILPSNTRTSTKALQKTQNAAPPLVPSSGQQKTWPQRLQRPQDTGKTDSDPFPSKAWVAPQKSEPPPAPTAPPFPYKFLGKMIQDASSIKLFLSKGDHVYTVNPGEVLDDIYRFDEIGENAIQVTYLPLGTKQKVAYAEITQKNTPTHTYANNTTGATRDRLAASDIAGSTIEPAADAQIPGGTQSSRGAATSGQQPSGGIGATPPASNTSANPSPASTSTSSGTASPSPGGTMIMLPAPAGTMAVLPAPTGSMKILPPSGTTMQVLPPSGDSPK